MRWPISPLSYVQCKAFHLNGVQTELKCKPNVKRCKRFVFVGHSPLLHHNTLKTKAITLFQADHILTRFVFPPLGVHPPGDDQRRVRRGRTKRVLHDLHHRAGGERSPETLQAGIAVQPSGSYRGVLSGLERQRYRKIPAVRPKGQRGRADIEPSCKTITIKSSITENGKDRHQPKREDT